MTKHYENRTTIDEEIYTIDDIDFDMEFLGEVLAVAGTVLAGFWHYVRTKERMHVRTLEHERKMKVLAQRRKLYAEAKETTENNSLETVETITDLISDQDVPIGKILAGFLGSPKGKAIAQKLLGGQEFGKVQKESDETHESEDWL